MDQEVPVVHEHPAGVVEALHPCGERPIAHLHPSLHLVDDRLDLSGVATVVITNASVRPRRSPMARMTVSSPDLASAARAATALVGDVGHVAVRDGGGTDGGQRLPPSGAGAPGRGRRMSGRRGAGRDGGQDRCRRGRGGHGQAVSPDGYRAMATIRIVRTRHTRNHHGTGRPADCAGRSGARWASSSATLEARAVGGSGGARPRLAVRPGPAVGGAAACRRRRSGGGRGGDR